MQKDEQAITSYAVEQAETIRSIVYQAGAAIMDFYQHDFNVELKADSSPVTEADMASNKIITEGLKNLPGDLPIISEENTIPEYTQRSRWKAWWLVDPLDGTKEFVKGSSDFTVNIALMFRRKEGAPGYPLAGWVLAPVQDLFYQGIVGKGAIKITAGNSPKPQQDILPMNGTVNPPRIVASEINWNAHTEKIVQAVSSQFGKGELIRSGSSLKLCRVAEGAAELYPRSAPTMEWDTAAADGVCRAAGVRVVQAKTGQDLEYGKDNLVNPWFLVSGREDILRICVEALGT